MALGTVTNELLEGVLKDLDFLRASVEKTAKNAASSLNFSAVPGPDTDVIGKAAGNLGSLLAAL